MEACLGSVSVHPTVLAAVARLTALATPGVARMSDARRLGRVLAHPGWGNGVDLSVVDDTITVDVYVVAEPDVNLVQLGQAVQAEVARAIRDMVGMQVAAVNVHIQDVDYPLTE